MKIWCFTRIGYLQSVCKCKTFVSCSWSKSAFFFSFFFLFSYVGSRSVWKLKPQFCLDFCYMLTQVSFVTNKLKWKNCLSSFCSFILKKKAKLKNRFWCFSAQIPLKTKMNLCDFHHPNTFRFWHYIILRWVMFSFHFTSFVGLASRKDLVLLKDHCAFAV